MYVYENSAVLGRTTGAQWEHVDISQVMLRQVYAIYAKVYISVYNSYTETTNYIDMEYYRTSFNGSSMTVNEWLVTMDGKPVEVVDEFPNAKLKSAKYANAVLHGYKIELAKAGFPYPDEMPITELTDLKITRPQYPTNLELLKTHCIMSVNGYFHRTDYDGTNAFVLDGGVTAAMNRCSHTGILSFLNIGRVDTHRLNEVDVQSLTPGAPLSEGVIIQAPEEFNDKSVMFILGGYLIRPEKNVFFKNSENTWVLNIRGLPYYERIQESETQLDLSSMKIEHLDTNKDNAIVIESILSDSAIKAYLTLSQSFFVAVDTSDLYFNEINVRVSNIPGLISAYDDPVHPLIMGYGKHVEYSKVSEENYWALRVADDWYVRYAWQTAPTRGVPVITNHYRTWQPYLRTQGYLLDIKGTPR